MAGNNFEIPREILLKVVVANNLKKLRKKHGLTQDELARLTGIDRVSIAKYETCQRVMHIEKLLLIAKVLGETPNTVLEGWEEIYK